LRSCKKYNIDIPFGNGNTLCTDYNTEMITTEYSVIFSHIKDPGVLYHWEPYGHLPKPYFLLEKGEFFDEYDENLYLDLLSRLKDAGHI